MLDPELSRRLGRAFSSDTIRSLSFDQHTRLLRAVERAKTFEDLPDWVQELVRRAEAERARRQ